MLSVSVDSQTRQGFLQSSPVRPLCCLSLQGIFPNILLEVDLNKHLSPLLITKHITREQEGVEELLR